MYSYITTAVFFLVVFVPLKAQIVNIEDKRAVREDSIEWYGNIDAGFNLVKNGNTVITINGSARLEYVRNRHMYISLADYSLMKVADEDIVNQGFQHLRYNYQVKKWLTWEVFVQGQYNERIDLKFRGLAGIGTRFRVFQYKEQKIYFGSLYMFEYDDYLKTDTLFRDHRLSAYLSFRLKPWPSLTLASTSYIQPELDLGSVRLSSGTALLLDITTHLSFKTTFNITHDSRQIRDVPRTIYSLLNGFRWKF